MEKKKLDLDTFGDVINAFLTEVEGMMLIKMPAGTQEVEVEDNIGAGSVVKFYFLLQALITISREMRRDMGLDRAAPEWLDVVDAMLGMARQEMMGNEQEA